MPLSQRANQSPFRQQRWVECENLGSDVLLAYSVAEIYEASRPEKTLQMTPGGGRTVLQLREPSADSRLNTAVLGPIDVPVGRFGICTMDFPAYVRLGLGEPVNNQIWGVRDGQTAIFSGYRGFRILGDYDEDNGLVRVMREESLPAPFALAQLNEDMCSTTDQPTIKTFQEVGYVGVEAPERAVNTFKLCGLENDWIFMARDNTGSWFIFQVQHHTDDVLTDAYQDGLDIKGTKQPLCIMKCEPPYVETLLTGTDCQ